jgi:uncharacterized protein (DUF2236 family)
MRPLRRVIAGEVHKLVQSRASSGFDPLEPRADPGFFGPGSVAWRVHGDFTTMMVGGVSALLLQMLHPAALAGVWDHSDFRRDMTGRLQSTATFLGGTTYGSTEQALALVARVRSIHDRVHGTLPDGPLLFGERSGSSHLGPYRRHLELPPLLHAVRRNGLGGRSGSLFR